MKVHILLITLVEFLITSPSFAIIYYMGEKGSIQKINSEKFNDCSKIYYRKTASKELDKKHKKKVIKAALKGDLINDLDAIKIKLKNGSNSCSYGDDSEKFIN